MLLCLYCQVKKTHQKLSKQIKLKWKYNKKRKININVVKDVNNSVQKAQPGRVEIELRQQCLQYGVTYIDREKDESRKRCMKRRKLMREHIQNAHVSFKNNKIMENNGDDIDFLVEFPDKDGSSFHAPSMADQNE